MKQLPYEVIFELIQNTAFSLDKNKRCYGMISHFFENYPYINFEQVQKQAEKLGFHVKKACDINSEDPHYKEIWESEKAIIIFWGDENTL